MSESSVKIKKRRKKDRFTQIANKALRDKRISLAVRGLFALMYSLPEDDEHPVSYYIKAGCISRETFYSYVKQLEQYGYLTREQTHQNGGKFGVNVYTLDDEPCTTFPNTVEPSTVLPNTEKPDTDKYSLEINTPPISPQGDERAEDKTVCAWKEKRFLRFWKFYRETFCAADAGRAGERARAATSWDKLRPDDETIFKMGAKLEAIMRTRQWQDGIGIQYASTFLNGVRMGKINLDDLPAPANHPRSDPPEPVREEDQWI